MHTPSIRTLLSAGVVLLALLAWPATTRAAANLLHDSSFEPNASFTLPTASWASHHAAPGGENAIVAGVARSGEHSFLIRTPASAQLTWYTSAQNVMGLKPGQTYTVSAYVKTEGMTDGHGAYCSLAFYDKGRKRIKFADSAKVKAASDWQRSEASAIVPEGAAYAQVVLVAHGHGQAWFDDVKLEQGAAATPYELPADTHEAMRAFAAARERARAVLGRLQREDGRGLAAIFREPGFPSTPASADPDALAETLRKHEYKVAFMSAEDMANPYVLPQCDIDALVLPYGPYFPARAAMPLKSYLRKGGDLVCTGGYAFDRLVVKSAGQWQPLDKVGCPQTEAHRVLFDFEDGKAAAWRAHADANTRQQARIAADPNGSRGLRLHTPSLKRWSCMVSPEVRGLTPRHTATRFRARGKPARFSVEWRERDGSRWRKFLDLSPQWRDYVVFADDLKYWRDNPSVGRGGTGDRFHPDRAQSIMLGFSIEFAARDIECELVIDDVAVDTDPLEGLRGVCLNARKGFETTGSGFLRVRPDQVSVFDPVYPLRRAAYAAAAAGQCHLPAGTRIDGPFEGWAAIGATGIDSHDCARYVPLLTAYDAYGRPRGPLAGLLHYYRGPFAGASIAFVGVTNRDVFARRGAQSPPTVKSQPRAAGLHAQEMLPSLVAAAAQALYLRDLKPVRNTVRPGEPAQFSVHAVNYRRAPADSEVLLRILSEDGRQVLHEARQTATLAPSEHKPLAFSWQPGHYDRDFYLVRAELQANGRTVDRQETGLCAWSERTLRSGPSVGLKDNVLSVAGRPVYLLGVQGFWGDRAISGGSPLTWLREFESMRDHGIKFCRFINVRAPWIGRPEEEVRAYEDALVQLSQKCGIVLFFEDKVWPTVDPALYQEHLARSRDVGRRYRDVKGMVIDLTNEPHLRISDSPHARSAFGDFLKARYGSADAVKKAWQGDFAGFGQEPALCPGWPKAEAWDDARTRDVYAFGVDCFVRWAADNRAALKQACPTRLVSVGMLGGYGHQSVITAPTLGSMSQDFANRHRYGELPGMLHHIKEMDLRLFGIPPSIGEFGATSHPSYPDRSWTDRSEAERITRYIHAAHYGLGLGAIFVSNWHFRDPAASIFPFGLAHTDLVDKDVLKVYRNLNLLFRLHRPAYTQPEVALALPDRHRWTVARHKVREAVRRSMDWLIGLHVDFAVVPESSVGRLPAGVKALVYPVPFCPDDATYDAVAAYVKAGGHLLVTGDITFDPHGRRTRVQRLEELFGARFGSQLYPHLSTSGRGTTIGAKGSFVAPYSGHPCIEIEAKDCEVLAKDAQGRPVVVSRSVGSGSAMFCTDPIEAHLPAEDTALYRQFLARAQVRRVHVEPDRTDVHAFVQRGAEDSSLVMVYNCASEGEPRSATVTAASGPVQLSAGPLRPALAMLDRAGRVLAVEGIGVAKVSGRQVMSASVHMAAGSLDQSPLAEARQFFVAGFGPGRVTIQHTDPGRFVAEVGELRGGRWTRLAVVPLKLSAEGVQVEMTDALAHEIVLVAKPEAIAAGRRALEAQLSLASGT